MKAEGEGLVSDSHIVQNLIQKWQNCNQEWTLDVP